LQLAQSSGGKEAASARGIAMSKSTENTGTPWSDEDVEQLKQLAQGNTPTRVIGLKLGRTEEAIYSKAKAEGIALGPPNQSPYG
jgi:hypothetical protein